MGERPDGPDAPDAPDAPGGPGGRADAEPLSAVHAHLAAFNARDVDAVVDTFADDAVFAAGEQVVVGRRALRALFADTFAAPVRAWLELNHAVVSGATAACELTETLAIGDARHTLDVAAFYTVHRGRLARVRIYRDLTDPAAEPPA